MYESLRTSCHETVKGNGRVGPVAPGAIKPEVGFEYEDAEANPTTVAGWVKCSRQLLADVSGLQALIQARRLAQFRTRLKGEVLSGDGSVSDRTG